VIVLSERGRTQRLDQVVFSPAGDLLAASGSGYWLDLWRLETPDEEPRRFFETEDPCARVFALAFWDNGNSLVAACGSQGLCVQPLSPDSAPVLAHRSTGHLQALAVSPDRRRVVGINNLPLSHFRQRAGIVPSYQSWASKDGRALREDWHREREVFARNAGPAFLPGGSRFLTTGNDAGHVLSAVSAFDSTAGTLCVTYPTCPFQQPAQGVVCSPSGESIVVRLNHALGLWSANDPTQPPRVIRNDNTKHFTGIAFHPSGRYLAATSNDATVKLYDTETWQVAKTYTWNVGRMRSVAFSPDGTLAAAGSDSGKVVVWDLDL
jgi:WD40 repeat protein